ncbi:TIGR02281 family clan AA aspartic protease [Mesorhizobium denitrificans]|uniref:TIGR02281 family clan AA aspartic protease n=1 Tax=Mesorhizobium denitrificans TaxID=2294114 RepID=A0A371XJR3_9HYPH|nr:TIGR02281 family clan AA aspartic protease [Mesorhizobium denitrificans]RFC69472.1 TIGR02281 family clan AA aspartic protease [Mesorhizobium denitrificans]
MLRLAIIFACIVLSVSWFSTSRGDGAGLHQFARRATTPSSDGVTVAAVNTAEIERATAQPLGRKVIIPADSKGQFESQFRVNDRNVKALVDTGATLVAINVSTAVKAGIKLKPSDFQHEVQTANGKTLAAAVMIDSMEIGRIRVKDVEALILQDSALHISLVGMSFLRRLDRFQVQDHTLLLVQ